MTIRNILTAGTLSALVGIAGVASTGQAFADDSNLEQGFVPLTVQVADAELDYSFEGDAFIDHGEVVENLDIIEEANLLEADFDAIDIN
ncbi:MAG: hypothetical protein V3R37_09605 [Rhodospirillales bacterium]